MSIMKQHLFPEFHAAIFNPLRFALLTPSTSAKLIHYTHYFIMLAYSETTPHRRAVNRRRIIIIKCSYRRSEVTERNRGGVLFCTIVYLLSDFNMFDTRIMDMSPCAISPEDKGCNLLRPRSSIII